MNHLKQIAAGLDEYGLDAMLVTSAPGEFYAVGFHGEGAVVVTSGECRYFTDSRYIEAAEKQVAGAHITMTDRSKNIQALVKGAVEELGVKKLGFEDGYMTVAQYNRYAGDLPCALTPANQLISKLRAAKDAEETLAENKKLASQALRVLAMAFKPVNEIPENPTPETDETDLVFSGLEEAQERNAERLEDADKKAEAIVADDDCGDACKI